MHEYSPIDQDSQGKIGQGSSHHDDATPANTLAIEGTMDFIFGDRTFALVEHFYVATQRKKTDRPFGLIFAQSLFPQHATKADRKPENLHATQSGRQVVSQFMKNNQDPQNHHKCGKVIRDVIHAKQRSRTILWAIRRASASAASTSARLPSGPAGKA